MKWDLFILLLMMLDVGWVRGTCVFNLEFGVTLDCNFKKSTLLRVRNLGGVKGYLGLGFSVGDDLAFSQALSNEDESAKRRSAPALGPVTDNGSGDIASGRSHTGRNPMLAWASAGGLPGSVPGALPGVLPGMVPGVGMSMMSATPTVPPFRPLGGAAASRTAPKAAPEPVATVPPFSALPASIVRIPVINKMPSAQPAAVSFQTAQSQMANRRVQVVGNSVTTGVGEEEAPMPPKNAIVVGKIMEPVRRPSNKHSSALALKQLMEKTTTVKPDMDINSPSPLLMGHSVQSLAQASNISVEAIAAALRLREQQLLASIAVPTTTTTTTTTSTTTPKPSRPPTVRTRYPLVGPNRVMNAPKEYYPVSYDKNYDDNFTSKVELPDTSFSCGDQKHFPGLYADEDLGCMVFHVCAFTDDGMVMKSFLCPESTLFDQSILKCNWWFYVDCKSSRKLYDSNIPISKSYQLMKALAFFSAYTNQTENATS
ncbi:hypothetical protein GE061_012391 [Apolygus lucorum]|uniref:Chitin-binding type-2 domain-containing protein n=1 Tax=Apolygus lucorum TaxID=248454 RepID=A0A8S9XW93_APOLU|nr:hypothetical protein GE061_012391 [Apolygus lucorum]